jgi:hypothetical protein
VHSLACKAGHHRQVSKASRDGSTNLALFISASWWDPSYDTQFSMNTPLQSRSSCFPVDKLLGYSFGSFLGRIGFFDGVLSQIAFARNKYPGGSIFRETCGVAVSRYSVGTLSSTGSSS